MELAGSARKRPKQLWAGDASLHAPFVHAQLLTLPLTTSPSHCTFFKRNKWPTVACTRWVIVACRDGMTRQIHPISGHAVRWTSLDFDITNPAPAAAMCRPIVPSAAHIITSARRKYACALSARAYCPRVYARQGKWEQGCLSTTDCHRRHTSWQKARCRSAHSVTSPFMLSSRPI